MERALVFASLCLIFLAALSASLRSMRRAPSAIFPLVGEAGVLASPREKSFEEASLPAPSAYKIPILMYHYVEYVQDDNDTVRKNLNTAPLIFEQQVLALKDGGYETLLMREVPDIIAGVKNLPKKPAALTFDDGYRDFYTDVFPLLKKYRMKATVYVIANLLDKPNNLTTEQVLELHQSGLVEIGSHTLNHVNLAVSDAALAKDEIVLSKRKLEKIVDYPVISFAYPNGSFNDAVKKMVEESGYETAVSAAGGAKQSLSNRFSLFRLRPGIRIGKELTGWLESL